MADSISRQFATWAASLRYSDLPPAVVDKARALLLHALTGARMGGERPGARHVVDMVRAEEARADGATILVDGAKATRLGATFANAELMHVSGLVDSYRMLTHAGPVLVPAALANAELEGRTGADLLVALVVGYEFMFRLCDDFIPSTAARGFRPSPVYGTMGAAMVAGKLMDFDEDRFVSAIAVAANCASGIFSGGGEFSIHEPNAARQGVFAAMVARDGQLKGAETAIEGRAGFYNAFTGSSTGQLSHSFQNGVHQVDLATLTQDLGSRFKLLDAMFRMYSTAGYNQPVIDLIVEMKQQHQFDTDEIERIDVSMNYIETVYPSPEFARMDPAIPSPGQTHFFAACAAVNGGYPVVGGSKFESVPDLQMDARIIDFMNNHVRIIPVWGHPMFSPEVAVRMNDGREFHGVYPYDRLAWNFDELAARLDECSPGYPGGKPALARLIEMTRATDRLQSMQPLYDLVRRGSAG